MFIKTLSVNRCRTKQKTENYMSNKTTFHSRKTFMYRILKYE